MYQHEPNLQTHAFRPPLFAAVPRLDLVQQLNEVEARRQEYPETLALLRLLNALLGPLVRAARQQGAAGAGAAAGGAVGGLPDGGADVSSFTVFVQQVGWCEGTHVVG